MMLMTIEFDNLHALLRDLYTDMMPLCGDMAGVAKGIAGLGALFYVALRAWQSLARAEPIDVYPMLRPFVIGFCILFFPTVVLGTLNGVLSPIVQGTAKMQEGQTMDMNKYREQKDKLEYESKMRNPETAYLVSQEEFDKQLEELGWGPEDMWTMTGMYLDRKMYEVKKWVRDLMREALELMFAAASLLIDTLRTFFLIVLSILGPIVFALSVWDGFQSTLSQWFSRYIQIYLWLPVSDLFSSMLARIQVLMLQKDIEAMQNNPDFSLDSGDGVYIVFMIIGILGYFTIPTVAGWIVQAGGGAGNYSRHVNTAGALAGGIAGAAAGNVGGRIGRGAASAGRFAKKQAGKIFRRNK
ncbi:conjugative transposon protein TraJ [Bacteroides fragilis]|nr:conjugative transposon protein TraJ [Bacteroides fragilis]MCM0238812.1 conjugative transposon protein TraJ [Bacteroides fragilis]